MTVVTEPITVTSENVTLSLIVWRRFKKAMPGLVEQTLELNPALADLGPFLPVGTTFNLPIPAEKQNVDINPVRLW